MSRRRSYRKEYLDPTLNQKQGAEDHALRIAAAQEDAERFIAISHRIVSLLATKYCSALHADHRDNAAYLLRDARSMKEFRSLRDPRECQKFMKLAMHFAERMGFIDIHDDGPGCYYVVLPNLTRQIDLDDINIEYFIDNPPTPINLISA